MQKSNRVRQTKDTNHFRESDSADKHEVHGIKYSLAGVDFDLDERDDDLFDRAHNRSRFAEPYISGNYSGIGPRDYKRSDERIYEDVCEALYRSSLVDASDITVKVSDGLVTLSGTVENRFSKREAESCVENITGVVDVLNEIRLSNITEAPRQEHQ